MNLFHDYMPVMLMHSNGWIHRCGSASNFTCVCQILLWLEKKKLRTISFLYKFRAAYHSKRYFWQHWWFHKNSWCWMEKCISVCTEGAKNMTGKSSGTITRNKDVAKNSSNNHCIIQIWFSNKKNFSFTEDSSGRTVKIIILIKTRPLRIYGKSSYESSFTYRN